MRPRHATEKDRPEVEALLRASSLSVEGMHDHIRQYIVARDKAGLLGCAGVERFGTTGVLHALAVAQRARSAGLGELLISAIVADLRQGGVELMLLQTTTSTGYFERLGFTSISISDLPPSVPPDEFSSYQNDSATLMQVAL